MTSFNYTTAEDLKDIRFGACLLDIVEELKLHVPLIKGNLLKRYHKQGCWGVKVIQQGRETDPKTDDIVITLISDSREKGLSTVMQELIGRLCGRHYQELKSHYSFHFGRRDEDGVPIDISEKGRKVIKRQRLYFQDLESHINNLEEESCFELLRNDELCGQLKEKDKKIQELEKVIKAQEEKLQEQDTKFQNQEKRVQEKNKKIRMQKAELANNEVEFETNRDLIERLRAEKRNLQEKNEEMVKKLKESRAEDLINKLRAEKKDLQEKNEAMAKELKEYKDAGFELVDEEVEEDEERAN